MSEAAQRWGQTLVWACGGQALVLGEHDLSHRHWCPVCDRRREAGCDIEYHDPHHRLPEPTAAAGDPLDEYGELG